MRTVTLNPNPKGLIMMNEILSRRNKLLGENFPTFYENPVHLTKGEGVWLYGADGKKYLDCYNNVPHVGHCHPKGKVCISD